MATTPTADPNAAALRRVLTAGNHFAVFGLSIPDAAPPVDARTIRKSYKTLALRIHPDKNDDPRATEAFKRLSMAMECLSDAGAQEEYIRSLASFAKGISKRGVGKRKTPEGQPRKRPPPQQKKEKERTKGPWWEGKSWVELEAEILRQEMAFFREQEEENERQKEKENQKRARRQQKHDENIKQVFKGHRAIFRHHGVEIHDLSERNNDTTYDLRLQGQTETSTETTIEVKNVTNDMATRGRAHELAREANETENEDISSREQKVEQETLINNAEKQVFACLLCQRQFKSESHLQRHIHTSKLHAQNVAYADFLKELSLNGTPLSS